MLFGSRHADFLWHNHVSIVVSVLPAVILRIETRSLVDVDIRSTTHLDTQYFTYPWQTVEKRNIQL